MFFALVFASTASAFTPYGLRPSGDAFPTQEACYGHYAELDGWTERKRLANFYHSGHPIVVYETPFGAVFVTCWEVG